MTSAGPRIVIVGTSGSGKSTLAARLSALIGAPHIELDALNWHPNWVQADDEIFRQRVAEAVSGQKWVVDGNYNRIRDIVWTRADTLVWLDLPFPEVMSRLVFRTMRRLIRKEELWNGNRESWVTQFFTRDSIFLWAIQTHSKKHDEYSKIFESAEWSHMQRIRLASATAADEWLKSVSLRV